MIQAAGPELDSGTLNTILLIVVIPVIGWLGRMLGVINKTLTSLHAAITGIEGHGGALEEIATLRRRVHKLESVVSALLIHTGIEPKSGRRTGDREHDDE